MSKSNQPPDLDALDDETVAAIEALGTDLQRLGDLDDEQFHEVTALLETLGYEDEAEALRASRRSFMKAAAGVAATGAAAGAGYFAGSGTASADPKNTQQGSYGNGDEDFDVQDITGNHADLNSVTTDKQSVKNQRVYVYGAEGNYLGSTDPSSTTTLDDAIAAIRNASGTGGTVMLPPQTTVEQQAGMSEDWTDITMLGHFGSSEVDVTGSGTFSTPNPSGGVADSYIDGVKFNDARSDKSSGSFFSFGSGNNAWRFNLGRVSINWESGPTIHFDSNHVFESRWEYVDLSGAGQAFVLDKAGPGLSIGTMLARSDGTAQTVAWNSGGGTIEIGTLYFGSEPGDQALYINRGANSVFSADVVMVEDQSGNAKTRAIELEGSGIKRIGAIYYHGGTVDYVLTAGFNIGNAVIGPIIANSATVNNTNVQITNSGPAEACWYFGSSSEVTNSAGSSTGNFRTLATAGTGNG